MTYEACIRYLYEQLPMFSRIGDAAIKKDLTNILLLCKALGNPHQKIKTIHIAGTNGKGSCAHLLSSVLQENGYKTGLYTSPHLKDFRERIKINGEPCSKHFVLDFVAKIKPEIARIHPSFFEITVAMAFDYFATEAVDIAVIETGLGGRLDSTNIIHPILSVITNISFDHTSMLGYSKQEIAGEKAGIIKKNTPVVIGRKDVETDIVFKNSAATNNAPLTFAEDLVAFESINVHKAYSDFYYTSLPSNTVFSIRSDLRAAYQQENIQTVYTALHVLKKEHLLELDAVKNEKGFLNCIHNAQFFGRWQTISSSPLVIADVAHNEDGVLQMLQQLHYEKYEHLHIIYGAVKDKDVEAILKLLPKDARYYFTEPTIPRKLDVDILAQKAESYFLVGEKYTSPQDALGAARKTANKHDLILITGSFFVLAEIL